MRFRGQETGDGREALRLARESHPDAVLMDITMPELNGLEATEQIKKDFPRMPVIILSVHTGEEYVVRALKAGASGYMDSAFYMLKITGGKG